ncbi:MAG: YkgJ family cysteine cluster protein [Clostridium sp.]|nr:YkgJ family cysteine cluster protein [Clostridium sp.]
MDERLKDIVDNLDTMKIGVDETFQFHCRMCGNCCINREDILLTPKDIYNMSKELGIATDDFCKKYCEVYIGHDSRIPLVRLQPRGADKRCPLLKKAKCRVHRAKPTVCAMYPIGRCLVAANPQEGLRDIDISQIQYIFNRPSCDDDSENHTVREWLESFGIPVPDEFFIRWQQVVLKMGIIFRTIEKGMSQNVMEQVWTAALVGIYLHYDTAKEFLPQFEANAKKFFAMMDTAFSLGNGSQ